MIHDVYCFSRCRTANVANADFNYEGGKQIHECLVVYTSMPSRVLQLVENYWASPSTHGWPGNGNANYITDNDCAIVASDKENNTSTICGIKNRNPNKFPFPKNPPPPIVMPL